MDDSRSRGDPTTGPAASLSEEHLRNIGAALWTLAFCAATAVIVFADGGLSGLGWRDATLIALRTFAGVVAFVVVFPVILAALSAIGLR